MGQFCVSIWLGYSTQLLNQKLDVATKVFLQIGLTLSEKKITLCSVGRSDQFKALQTQTEISHKRRVCLKTIAVILAEYLACPGLPYRFQICQSCKHVHQPLRQISSNICVCVCISQYKCLCVSVCYVFVCVYMYIQYTNTDIFPLLLFLWRTLTDKHHESNSVKNIYVTNYIAKA